MEEEAAFTSSNAS